MTYQDTDTMIDLLKKAQEAQVAVLLKNDGHSLHIDQGSHENWPADGGHHVSFEVTLFDGNVLLKSWDFNAMDNLDDLEHTLSDMQFHLNRI